MNTVQTDEFAAALVAELSQYSEDVTEGIKKSVDTVCKEVNDEIKSHISFRQRTGKYIKAFRIPVTYESRHHRERTWCVVNGEYRKTHLLEKGHAKKGGGRTRAYPHIRYGEELAHRRMEELTEEAIKNAGH